LAPEDLYKAVEAYPESARLLQISAMKLAMQTAIVIISEYVRSAKHVPEVQRDPNVDKQIEALTKITGNAPRFIDEEGFLAEELEDDHLEKADDRTLLMEVLKVVQKLTCTIQQEREERHGELAVIREDLRRVHQVLGSPREESGKPQGVDTTLQV